MWAVRESFEVTGGPQLTLKGLPAVMGLKLIEPLRECFKDEGNNLSPCFGGSQTKVRTSTRVGDETRYTRKSCLAASISSETFSHIKYSPFNHVLGAGDLFCILRHGL